VIDCHSTGYHALGSQGWLPTLALVELLDEGAHAASTSSTAHGHRQNSLYDGEG
jgi:hypothetical protein